MDLKNWHYYFFYASPRIAVGTISNLTNLWIFFSFLKMENRLILASKSPHRYTLLKQEGLDFDVIRSRIEENEVTSVNMKMIRTAEIGTVLCTQSNFERMSD